MGRVNLLGGQINLLGEHLNAHPVNLLFTSLPRISLTTLVQMIVSTGAGACGYNYCVEFL